MPSVLKELRIQKMFKILVINLIIFTIYGLLIILNTADADRGFNIAIGMGFCIFTQVMVNVFAGFVFLILGKQKWMKSFFITGAVLAPIGFVTWLILLSIYG